ncbi:DUF1565 domain-containing protein [Nostoc sphaeroides CHAB 2801]|uniref:DUF1565 domain-containing protein n=1 Tax=Nostoc sphaeroides TaxID=446679 RepID=UPI000E48B3E6|nr:DUF1565 domain-containing protein [Nostoc sphaeroides]MCC5627259.1 DUF1565 domain-containing protein [Nostoc sphaeroides CHAB 2801]
MAQTFYVNPVSGNNTNPGSQQAPFKTITQALKVATVDTKIQLANGNYNAASGEVFPLTVPSGVTVVGNETNKGNGILIEGSGSYLSRTFAAQNVTFVLLDKAEVRGVTVTNLASRGSGVWIESTAPTVANSTFTNCKREGVFTTGEANPVILGNVFSENAANGIAIAKNSKGQIIDNTCLKTGFGIAISDTASPTLRDNKIYENRSGIVISGSARPVLRNNVCENNTDDGITVIGTALPDIGSTNNLGGNTLRNNGKFNLQNASSNKLVSVGNKIDTSKVTGNVEFADSSVPTPSSPTAPIPSSPTAPIPSSPTAPIPSSPTAPIPSSPTAPIPSSPTAPIPISPTAPIPSSPTAPIPSSPTAPIPTPTIELTDITNHWAGGFIRELVKLGIVNGFPDRTFKPDATMTRAQYAALLVKAFNPSPNRPVIKFKDVPADFWASKVIQQAYQGLFLSGFPDNTFAPNKNIQRVQVIVSLVNGLGLSADSATVTKTFDDQAKIPEYAKDEVVKAIDKGIIVNHPNVKQLNPTRDATRAEVAVMVYQALVDADRVAAINSPYIVA